MRHILAGAAAIAAPWQVEAADFEVQPLAEARLRAERVDQDDLTTDSTGLTLRARFGLKATHGTWTALAEGQGSLALDGGYYDGLHGAATRPGISDPQNIALYRAQLGYKTDTLALTAGRQRIAIDDERFVGNAAFRQNAQTFDAVRAEWTALPGLKADLSYVWSVRTIWGIAGGGARQQAVRGNNVLANLGYASPIGTVSGFAYLVDQDEAAVQGYQLSSQSYGARLAGSRALSPRVTASWQASYARQSDWHRNPNRYRVDYYLIDGAIETRGLRAGAGYEVLGASSGGALTSFQTPLASVFKFQGWADKFLTTPPDGVRDRYATLGYTRKQAGPFTDLTLQALSLIHI